MSYVLTPHSAYAEQAPLLRSLLFCIPSTLSFLMHEPRLFVARGAGCAPDHQAQNRKLIFHSAPTAVRQIYVDTPSINGWKIDGLWCPWVEHEAAAGIVDTGAIFGRSAGLSFNLAGQPTDALLHALEWPGKMEGRRARCRNVSVSLCVRNTRISPVKHRQYINVAKGHN